MKKILFILFFFVSFVSYGQVYQLMPQYGYQTNRMNFDSTLQIPTTCGVPTLKTTYNVKRAAIAFDSCNNRYYYYNPKTTSWAFLGSTSGKVDSVTKSSSTYVDTFKYWINGTATIYATIDKPDGLISGGDVTQNTQTNFTIKSAIYRIGGVRYTTRDTTISIAALPDTPRIDLFVIDTSGKTKYLQGTESQSAAPPNYDREKAIALSFVFVYNDSSFVSVPPTRSYWAIFPKSQYPANSLVNTNGSDIVLSNGFWLPNILEGQSSYSTYKPLASDADGNVVRMDNWTNLQQTTDVGAVTDNVITLENEYGGSIFGKTILNSNELISGGATIDLIQIKSQIFDNLGSEYKDVFSVKNRLNSNYFELYLGSDNITAQYGRFRVVPDSIQWFNESGSGINLINPSNSSSQDNLYTPLLDGITDTIATLRDVKAVENQLANYQQKILKEWTGLITFNNTSDPSVDSIFINEIGYVVSFRRVATGEYYVSFDSESSEVNHWRAEVFMNTTYDGNDYHNISYRLDLSTDLRLYFDLLKMSSEQHKDMDGIQTMITIKVYN